MVLSDSVDDWQLTAIQSRVSKEILLRLMSDKPSRQILEATIDSPRSATELATGYGISLNTVYRRLRILVENKIIKTSGIITDEGKKTFLYHSRIRGVKIHHIGTSLEIEVIPNDVAYNIRIIDGKLSCPVCVLLSEEKHQQVAKSH